MTSSDTICYCFGYSASDIEEDFTRNGRSTILERIQQAKKRGGCQCALNHPRKR